MADNKTPSSPMQAELEKVKEKVLKALPGAARLMVGGLVNEIFGFLTKVVARQDKLEAELARLNSSTNQ